MTQTVTKEHSIKVNLGEETFREIEQRATRKGISLSATARSILREKVITE